MQVIPVLDILNGIVVRGIAGKREQYQPIRSQLTTSSDPSVMMHTIIDVFGFSTVYVADLDAIQGRQFNRCTIAEMTRSSSSLWVDRGVRSVDDVQEMLDLNVSKTIVALETLVSTRMAQTLIHEFGADQLVLSLDLKWGKPMTSHPRWQHESPDRIAAQLIEIGFTQFIVLDLAAVGMDSGVTTVPLCDMIRRRQASAHIVTGGGVRDSVDLSRLKDAGIDGVLVASALHDGRISAAELNSF